MILNNTAGMNSRMRKLDADDVTLIRALYDRYGRERTAEIALLFRISQAQVYKIGKRKIWKSV